MRIDAFKFRVGGFVRLPTIKQATAGKTGPDIVALSLEFDSEDGSAPTTLSTHGLGRGRKALGLGSPSGSVAKRLLPRGRKSYSKVVC